MKTGNMRMPSTFLRPTWKKGLWFIAFALIAVGAQIQSWGFYDTPPKPLLYDVLAPLPLWLLWVLLCSPILTLPVMADGPFWVFEAAQAIYGYLLSCLLVVSFDRYKQRVPRWLRLVSLIVPLALLLCGSIAFVLSGENAPRFFFSVEVLLPYVLIGMLLLYLLGCLGFFACDALKSGGRDG